ncbi:MAG: DUF454 family protein [Pseudohongiellaceae bacterium]
MPWKIIGLVLVAGLLFIGLVGLILPLIPGLIFLAIAVWLLAKISTRFAALLDDSPTLAKRMGFLRRTEGLSLTQRLRLSFWVMAKMVVRGVESGVAYFRK